MAAQSEIGQCKAEIVISVAETGTVVRISNKAKPGISFLAERFNSNIQPSLSLQDNIKGDFDVIGVNGAVKEYTGLAALHDPPDIVVIQQLQTDYAVCRLQQGRNYTTPDFLGGHILHGDRGAPGSGKMLQL